MLEMAQTKIKEIKLHKMWFDNYIPSFKLWFNSPEIYGTNWKIKLDSEYPTMLIDLGSCEITRPIKEEYKKEWKNFYKDMGDYFDKMNKELFKGKENE